MKHMQPALPICQRSVTTDRTDVFVLSFGGILTVFRHDSLFLKTMKQQQQKNKEKSFLVSHRDDRFFSEER